MGDGDGAAGGDLLLKNGDDAAGGAQDVAEADGEKTDRVSGFGFRVSGPFFETRDPRPETRIQRLNVQLGKSFGRAHDAGGVYGFVGGDHDKGGCAASGGGVGYDLGAEDVVLDRFAGVELHHGDVLVGGAVEDHLGTLGGEGSIDARLV